jgi:hypothetical protein
VAIGSVDLLIQRLTPDARRLLRLVTLANEPVSEGFIDGVWQGKGVEDEQLDQLAEMLELLERLPDDAPQRRQIEALLATDQGKQVLERLQHRPPAPQRPPIGPLLAELRGTGLVTREVPAEGQATYGYHELVRERMAEWGNTHPDASDPRSDDQVRIAYGERYAALFRALYHQDREAAGEAGRRALV